MTVEAYIKKCGSIYGVSSKHEFGSWNHHVVVLLDSETAKRWLAAEEYDFRERELMSRSRAVKLAGKAAVADAPVFEKEAVHAPENL